MAEGGSGRTEFTPDEVRQRITQFLQNVGYQLRPPSCVGTVCPDFHSRRTQGSKTYEILGLARQNVDEAEEGFRELAEARAVLGDAVDYVLVFPPTSEHLWIELLTADKGRLFSEIKDQEFMVWLCNPERETVHSLLGWPRDELFTHYFANLGKISFDSFIAMRLSKDLLEEEDF